MAQRDALERALPFAAIAETILTKGKSPGNTSLGQLDRLDNLKAQEAQSADKAVGTALDRELKRAQIKKLGDPAKLSVSEKKFAQTQKDADAKAKRNAVHLESFKNNPSFLGRELTPIETINFKKDPELAIEAIEEQENKLAIAQTRADMQALSQGRGFVQQGQQQQRVFDQQDKKDAKKLEIQLTKEQKVAAKALSKRLTASGAPSAIKLMNDITDKLQIDDPNADIAGFGETGLVPRQLLSKGGKKNRQLVQGFINITLKDRSGAAVTIPEFERFKAELGTGFFETDEQLRNGLKTARDALLREIKTIEAPFLLDLDGGTIQELKRLGLTTSSDILIGGGDDNDALLDELGI